MALPVDALTASPAVTAKIRRKHGVTLDEVEQVVFGWPALARRARAGLYLVYGRTFAGRYLVVVIRLVRRRARLVTARDMTWRERRSYGKQTRS